MNAVCSIQDCVAVAHRRGWCWKHYARWKAHGDPLTLKRRENGTGTINANGYITVCSGGRKAKFGVRHHVAIAEKALGHKLPAGAIVHHANGDATDNSNTNLVICPSQGYHRLIHKRLRAFLECGNPEWHYCRFCRRWAPPEFLYVRGNDSYHRACKAAENAALYASGQTTRQRALQRPVRHSPEGAPCP